MSGLRATPTADRRDLGVYLAGSRVVAVRKRFLAAHIPVAPSFGPNLRLATIRSGPRDTPRIRRVSAGLSVGWAVIARKSASARPCYSHGPPKASSGRLSAPEGLPAHSISQARAGYIARRRRSSLSGSAGESAAAPESASRRDANRHAHRRDAAGQSGKPCRVRGRCLHPPAWW